MMRYHPVMHVPSSSKGLAEKIVRAKLENSGWLVWRGSTLNCLRRDELYPNIRRKYTLLKRLMNIYKPKKFEYLEYLCAVHHGLPDFFCFKDGYFKFVECKFRHEPLSKRQKQCIKKLLAQRFIVEVHKVVTHETKMRKQLWFPEEEKKMWKEKQMTLPTRRRAKKKFNDWRDHIKKLEKKS